MKDLISLRRNGSEGGLAAMGEAQGRDGRQHTFQKGGLAEKLYTYVAL